MLNLNGKKCLNMNRKECRDKGILFHCKNDPNISNLGIVYESIARSLFKHNFFIHIACK